MKTPTTPIKKQELKAVSNEEKSKIKKEISLEQEIAKTEQETNKKKQELMVKRMEAMQTDLMAIEEKHGFKVSGVVIITARGLDPKIEFIPTR